MEIYVSFEKCSSVNHCLCLINTSTEVYKRFLTLERVIFCFVEGVLTWLIEDLILKERAYLKKTYSFTFLAVQLFGWINLQ